MERARWAIRKGNSGSRESKRKGKTKHSNEKQHETYASSSVVIYQSINHKEMRYNTEGIDKGHTTEGSEHHNRAFSHRWMKSHQNMKRHTLSEPHFDYPNILRLLDTQIWGLKEQRSQK